MNLDDLNLGVDQDSEEEEKKPTTKAELDEDTLKEMIMTGENTDGMFSPNEEELLDPDDPDDKLHEDQDEIAEMKMGAVGKKFGEYQKKLLKDMKKNPQDYTIMTPEGEMNVIEAMKKGYDPLTKEFSGEAFGDHTDENLEGLAEDQKAAIKGLLDPSAAHMSPAQGEGYGLDPNNPMIDQGAGMAGPPGMGGPMMPPEEEEGQQAMAGLEAMLGGSM